MLTKKLIPCLICDGKDKHCTFCNGTGKVELVEDDDLDDFHDIGIGEALRQVGNTILRR